MGNYSLGWFGDSWYSGGPTAWLSGYGGVKLFTSKTPRLAIKRKGNVGIGTTDPSQVLEVRAKSDKENDGITIQNDSGNTQLRMNEDGVQKFAITHVKSDNSVRFWTNKGGDLLNIHDGIVKINRLKVSEDAEITGNIVMPSGYLSRTNSPKETFKHNDLDMGTYALGWFGDKWYDGAPTLWLSSYGGIKLFTSNTPRLSINHKGNVGIGTENPTKGKVEIVGSLRSKDSRGYRAFKRDSNNLFVSDPLDYNAPYSLYAYENIGAKEFNAISDMRIKDVKGVSDSKPDLKVLLQVDIVDYTYKDRVINDNKPHKKVLGQQIAEVFPQAVRTHTDVVPDIFQTASIANGWVSLCGHGLEAGERVQLLLEDSEPKIYTIEAVTPESFQVSLDYEGEVFVYGREVDDFHVVDYDAISMLHISATQELYKIIHALKIEVQQLKAQLNVSHHTIAAINE